MQRCTALRQHFVHAHVDKELRTRLGLKKRAVQISKGDTVKIMSGSKRGTTGKGLKGSISERAGYIWIRS